MSSRPQPLSGDGVVLYWLPLGAGDNPHCVRWSGRTFEQLMARMEHRERCDLYHSALEVRLHGDVHVIEMAPVWRSSEPDRGVVCEGPVGTPLLGHSRLFRYEVRCWRNGVIPDLAWAVGSPDHLSTGVTRAQQLLELVPHFPTATWGRDEMHAGDMWNSNSLISWLLARSGHDISHVHPPAGGRAPGWVAGLTVAARAVKPASDNPTQQARAAAPLTSAIASVLEAPSSGRHSDQPIDDDAGQRSGQSRYWLPLSPAVIRDADQAARTELDIVCP